MKRAALILAIIGITYAEYEFYDERCFYRSMVPGQCNARLKRWSYKNGRCILFIWGGCGRFPFENRFDSKAECLRCKEAERNKNNSIKPEAPITEKPEKNPPNNTENPIKEEPEKNPPNNTEAPIKEEPEKNPPNNTENPINNTEPPMKEEAKKVPPNTYRDTSQ